jgi:Mitochondrial glycoprotein
MSSWQFETLDLNLQEEFERFFQERGINESLAFFVPEYAQYKEQKVRSVACELVACNRLYPCFRNMSSG